MELITKKNYDELSKAVGDFVIDYVGKKPDSLICFAGGDTPLGLIWMQRATAWARWCRKSCAAMYAGPASVSAP